MFILEKKSLAQICNYIYEKRNIQKSLRKEIHYPDYEIFLDAHDLCFIHKNLEFITSDYAEKKIDYVKSQTNITRITDLRKFIF